MARPAGSHGSLWLASSLLLPLLGASRTARADDVSLPQPRLVPQLSLAQDKGVESVSEDTWSSKKKTASLFGAAPGNPLGVAGVMFEYSPSRYLVLGGGGGWAPDGGLRAGVAPRLRLPLNRLFAVGLGFPLTAGAYEYSVRQPELCQNAGCSIGYRTTRSWPLAVWGQIEPNVELRIASDIALRLYAGYARVLNNEGDQCASTLTKGCPSDIGSYRVYGGLALGYAW